MRLKLSQMCLDTQAQKMAFTFGHVGFVCEEINAQSGVYVSDEVDHGESV